MGELILTIPNTDAGRRAIEHLTGRNPLGVTYLRSMLEMFAETPELEPHLRGLAARYHLVRVEDGDELYAIMRVLQYHDRPEGWESHGKVDGAEINGPVVLTAPVAVSLDPKNHSTYLGNMNVSAARADNVNGTGITVAVIDSGADANLDDFYDVLASGNMHPGLSAAVDTVGHGTAMAALIKAVAPDVRVVAVRFTDSSTSGKLWYMHAALILAGRESPDIVNLSVGFSSFGSLPCPVCGSSAHARSLAFEGLLESLARFDLHRPVFVAASGNDGSASRIDYPAAWDCTVDAVVAVGAVNSANVRSGFSNYESGATHRAYCVAPGGDGTAVTGGSPTVGEAVGTIAVGYAPAVPFAGTSAATAYASGMLAVLRSDPRYAGLTRADFLDRVRRDHCVQLPTGSPDVAQYGAGLLRYVSPPEDAESADAERLYAGMVVQEEFDALNVFRIDRRPGS